MRRHCLIRYGRSLIACRLIARCTGVSPRRGIKSDSHLWRDARAQSRPDGFFQPAFHIAGDEVVYRHACLIHVSLAASDYPCSGDASARCLLRHRVAALSGQRLRDRRVVSQLSIDRAGGKKRHLKPKRPVRRAEPAVSGYEHQAADACWKVLVKACFIYLVVDGVVTVIFGRKNEFIQSARSLLEIARCH